jgi:hypothetical protein
MATPLSEEEFKKCLPAQMRKSVSPELVKGINNVLADPNTLDFLRENILGYTEVLKQGKFKLVHYLNAVHYVSHKLMGASNIQAYIKTFPDKYQKFLENGTSDKDQSAYASVYNKSKLVVLIMEQTLVPCHVLNAPLHQEALNVQADLMRNAASEKVRSEAANYVLIHTKPPEKKQIELDIGIKGQDSVIADLRKSTQDLLEAQKELIRSGANPKQIATSKLAITYDDDTIDV